MPIPVLAILILLAFVVGVALGWFVGSDPVDSRPMTMAGYQPKGPPPSGPKAPPAKRYPPLPCPPGMYGEPPSPAPAPPPPDA